MQLLKKLSEKDFGLAGNAGVDSGSVLELKNAINALQAEIRGGIKADVDVGPLGTVLKDLR